MLIPYKVLWTNEEYETYEEHCKNALMKNIWNLILLVFRARIIGIQVSNKFDPEDD